MASEIQQYIPISLKPALKNQAVKVWLIGCAVVLTWRC